MTVPMPSVCPECKGEGVVVSTRRISSPALRGQWGDTTSYERWCGSCRCVLCGVPSLDGLCEACRVADEIEDDQRHVRAADV